MENWFIWATAYVAGALSCLQMENHISRSANQQFGIIAQCPYEDCAFRCCNFELMSFIALYPGELDKAVEQGHLIEHLEVIDSDFYGGAKAICHARDTTICDGSYKPLDCASYPVFPLVDRVDEQELTHAFKGDDCPLENHMVEYHARRVLAIWSVLANADPKIMAWLVQVTKDTSNPEHFSVLM